MGKLVPTPVAVLPAGQVSPRCPGLFACGLLVLGCVLTTSGVAQSLPAPTPKPQPPPKEIPATAAASSRYACNDLKPYIEALANQFAIRDRPTDPFAQPQDPNAKIVVKTTQVKAIRRPTAEPPAALSDIVGRIPITTIMPGDKRFLVGSRSIGQGDKIPINYRNKSFRTEVTEVNSRRIVFRNLDTGEIGIRQLNLLPQGMTPGSGNIAAPGMIPISPNAPLEIDSSSPSSAGTNNP
jgi:hypothetical protein